MLSLQDYLHDGQSDLETLSSSESLLVSQYLEAYSELPPSSNSSYYSADTQPDEIIDPEKDEENILAFIAALDTVSDTSETGWTHAEATLALDANRRRCESSPDGDISERSTFDFFSHFDPMLRSHLRHSYDRRTRWGYTGDAQQGLSSDVATLQRAKLRDLINAIGTAIDTPAQKSREQLLRTKDREDMERMNREMDEIDGRFEGTWKGVLNSTIALGSVVGNYVRKRIAD